MMDRLVCADGGNPDPTTTRGKDPEKAKALELAGWPYPRHLAGRGFAVVAHGDSQGHESLREALVEWLSGNGLVQAGASAAVDTLIGYYEPYATSHEKLDAPTRVRKVENAAKTFSTGPRSRSCATARRTPVARPASHDRRLLFKNRGCLEFEAVRRRPPV